MQDIDLLWLKVESLGLTSHQASKSFIIQFADIPEGFSIPGTAYHHHQSLSDKIVIPKWLITPLNKINEICIPL